MHIDYNRLRAYQMEKEAFKGKLFGDGLKWLGTQAGKLMKSPAAKSVTDNAKKMLDTPVGKGLKGFADDTAQVAKRKAKELGDAVGPYAKPVGTGVGTVGQGTITATRGALNKLDDLAQWALSGPNRAKAPGAARWGDTMIGPTGDNPLSVRNVGVGAGTLAGGYQGASALMGGGGSAAAPAAANPVAEQVVNQTSTGGGGVGGFLSNMPREMQYALAAGVPLALLGAYMGGRGNTMGGLGLGALGLGAAGLGAAGAGYFGDDARRFVGQGANSLMGLFGGNKDGDIMGQINQLSRLSPEFGVTMLMGRNPGLSREEAQRMYEFLTQNRDSISKMLPSLTGAPQAVKAGAAIKLAIELDKVAGRCWKGYEPVPGKKPYSNDSCRPVGSKKKKEKQAMTQPMHMLQTGVRRMMQPQRPQMPQVGDPMPQMPQMPQRRGGLMMPPQGDVNNTDHLRRSGLDPRNPSMMSPAYEKGAFIGALAGGAARMAGRGLMRAGANAAAIGGSAAAKQVPSMANVLGRTPGGSVANALGGVGRMLGAGTRGAVQAAGAVTGMAGRGLNAAGQAASGMGSGLARGGERLMGAASQMARKSENPMMRFMGNAAGTVGGGMGMAGNAMQGAGGLAQGVGTVANMAGKGLQMAGKNTATALPVAAAGAYGGYQAARPYLPSVQFQNPIADAGGVDVRAPKFQAPVRFGT